MYSHQEYKFGLVFLKIKDVICILTDWWDKHSHFKDAENIFIKFSMHPWKQNSWQIVNRTL